MNFPESNSLISLMIYEAFMSPFLMDRALLESSFKILFTGKGNLETETLYLTAIYFVRFLLPLPFFQHAQSSRPGSTAENTGVLSLEELVPGN